MGSMKKIAVIGAGGIAQSVHFPSLKEIAGFQVQAVCDVAAGRAQQAAAQFPGAAWYDNYRVMLEREELDGVFVLVQPDQSFRIAADSMRAGLHVFCEKPAGITLFQLESLERLQREKGVVLQVGFNRRFIPLVQKVAEPMAPLGPITQVGGCFFKNSSASFYDGCASSLECDVIHVADLVCSFACSDGEL
jgi:predicted dehydrogenase